jgi:hypothetical protein
VALPRRRDPSRWSPRLQGARVQTPRGGDGHSPDSGGRDLRAAADAARGRRHADADGRSRRNGPHADGRQGRVSARRPRPPSLRDGCARGSGRRPRRARRRVGHGPRAGRSADGRRAAGGARPSCRDPRSGDGRQRRERRAARAHTRDLARGRRVVSDRAVAHTRSARPCGSGAASTATTRASPPGRARSGRRRGSRCGRSGRARRRCRT